MIPDQRMDRNALPEYVSHDRHADGTASDSADRRMVSHLMELEMIEELF